MKPGTTHRHRPSSGVKSAVADMIRHSTFGIRHFFTPLSPPPLAPRRPSPFRPFPVRRAQKQIPSRLPNRFPLGGLASPPDSLLVRPLCHHLSGVGSHSRSERVYCSGVQPWTHQPGKPLRECWRSARKFCRLPRCTGKMSEIHRLNPILSIALITSQM